MKKIKRVLRVWRVDPYVFVQAVDEDGQTVRLRAEMKNVDFGSINESYVNRKLTEFSLVLNEG